MEACVEGVVDSGVLYLRASARDTGLLLPLRAGLLRPERLGPSGPAGVRLSPVVFLGSSLKILTGSFLGSGLVAVSWASSLAFSSFTFLRKPPGLGAAAEPAAAPPLPPPAIRPPKDPILLRARRAFAVLWKVNIKRYKKAVPAKFAPSLSLPPFLGSLSTDDGDGSENVTAKMNLRFFKLRRVYSHSPKMSNIGVFPWSWLLGDRTQV